MAEDVIRSIARVGFSGRPDVDLSAAIDWCRRGCEEDADARLCVLGDALEELSEWWNENSETLGGVPSALVSRIEECLRDRLPAVLSTEGASGVKLATSLRLALRGLLLSESDWQPLMKLDHTSDRASGAISRHLVETGAVSLNTEERYRFVSGLLSPIYVDTRQLISSPRLRGVVVEGFTRLVSKYFSEANCVAGVATGGIPWAAWLSNVLDLPMVYVRSAPKERGLARQIEGTLPTGARVLIVEDLITTGLSTAGVVDALRASGVSALGVVSVFSYDLPIAARRFESLEVTQKAILGVPDLLDVARDRFSPEDLQAIKQWIVEEAPLFRGELDQ